MKSWSSKHRPAARSGLFGGVGCSQCKALPPHDFLRQHPRAGNLRNQRNPARQEAPGASPVESLPQEAQGTSLVACPPRASRFFNPPRANANGQTEFLGLAVLLF
jgi:hypothetical protein